MSTPSKKSLPIGEPVASGYQFYAFPLAILATMPQSTDWILSNYIQLAFDRRMEDSPVPFCFYLYDYASSPFLDVVKADRAWLSCTGQDIVGICRAALAGGYHPYLNVDEFHIPDRAVHGRSYKSHDVLLCGYDDDSSSFTAYGYNSRATLTTSVVGYADFARAYASLDTGPNGCTQVYFYRPRPQARYDMRPHVIRESFEEYLAGANCSTRFAMLQQEWDRAYGMDSYDLLEAYLAGYLAGDKPADMRHFHLLWEHKRLMTQRIRRLCALTGGALDDLVDDCRVIEADALALRVGAFRHRVKGESSAHFARSAPTRLARVRASEERVLSVATERLRSVEGRH